MKFQATRLKGAFVIDLDLFRDERGFFARTWTPEDMKAHGLTPRLAQTAVAFNAHKGTMRGMHYQISPYREAKLVRCTRGSIFDVIVDLRPDSPTYCRWAGYELTEDNYRALYVPEGFAHGYVTLSPKTEVLYYTSRPYSPAHYRGVRWNDPAFGIRWPRKPALIAERDATYPDFKPRRSS